VLTLGNRRYNVVEYQAMLQRKLRSWEGQGSPLTDDSGNSLIFSMTDLVAQDGTVRHDFTDQAIVAGGVHPTNTGCVKGDDFVTKGRYRNGALVTQFVNLNVFTPCTGNGCSLDKVIVQEPEDLPEEMVLSDGSRVAMKVDLNGDGAVSVADYEVFGGIRGFGIPENTNVMFESTIFWHYPGGACYGEDGWETDVQEAISEYVLTEEEFLLLVEENGYAGTNLDEEYQRVQQCIAADGDDRKNCEKELEVLDALLAAREMVPELQGGVDDGLASDGETPFIMGGEASDLGMTAGPNFQVGRRTWTDVFGE
jgi:hypothetical protein